MGSMPISECFVGLPKDGINAKTAAALVREELSPDTLPIYNFAR
jgi:hypothetical protein